MGIFLLLNTCFNLQLPIIKPVLKKLKMKEKEKVSKDQDSAVKMLQTEEGSLQLSALATGWSRKRGSLSQVRRLSRDGCLTVSCAEKLR